MFANTVSQYLFYFISEKELKTEQQLFYNISTLHNKNIQNIVKKVFRTYKILE